ncbi:hypothetical protein [Methylobrevis pamukkalensis]|uniref:Uncharacterized protein n=1 Tax=Methylobrevis pamukkalensis TaxID=1439726 RepID=A0A1E3H609_9HYPH|nr:hypothetical protein [Methylobrevis pamukkalensis]ODN71752.1 hypothetical protein A6302_00894 [Methylobrevis pamukkalensis]
MTINDASLRGATGRLEDDRLHFIAQMSAELARMAEDSGQSLLAYLLGMAREEATLALADLDPPPARPELRSRS